MYLAFGNWRERKKIILGVVLFAVTIFTLWLVVGGILRWVYWWPMFRRNLNNTGYSGSTAPNTDDILWTYETGDWVHSSPAVVSGVVYIGSAEQGLDGYYGIVYALDSATGQEKWSYRVGDYVQSSPAVADGKVYVGSWDNNVYALNARTGEFIWSYTTGGDVNSSPAVSDGKVFIGSWDNNFYALPMDDPNGDGVISSSEVIWSYTTGGWVDSSPAVADGKVFIGSWDNNVYALNARTGGLLWKFTTGKRVMSSPAVADGKVFVGSYDKNFYALPMDDPNGDGIISSSEVIWSYTTGGAVRSSPAIANDKVFVGSFDEDLWAGYVHALDANTGEVIWRYEMIEENEYLWSSPAVADGKIFINTWGGEIRVLPMDDPNGDGVISSSEVIWTHSIGFGDQSSSPAVAVGRVYVGSNDKKVYAFGPP